MRHIWFPLVLLVVSAIARADDPKTLDDYKKLVTPAMRKTLDEQFTFLNRWPDASAQKAVEQIVSIGHAAIPDLIEELNGGHWRAQVASAYICGQLRRPITYEAVANSARQPKVQPHLGIYFKALARIDRSRAIKTLSGFIESRFPDVRQLALRYSVGLVKQSDLPMIVKLAEHPRVATRVVAMTLLGLAGGDQARSRLLKGLEDADPKVATAASKALAAESHPAKREKTVALLQGKLGVIDRRHRAYVALTLVRLEDAHGGQLFPVGQQHIYLRMVSHSEPFVRAAAAIAVANFGRYSNDSQVTKTLDQLVVPRLIQTLGSSVYFKDYMSVRQLSVQKLRHLSGEDYGADYRRWSRWWLSNKEQFQAIRRLERVPVERLADLQIILRRYLPGRQDDRWMFCCSRPSAFQKHYPEALVYVLSLLQMNDLVDNMGKTGFFTQQTDPLTVAEGQAFWQVELNLGRRKRQLICGAPVTSILSRLTTLLSDLGQVQEWQRYWDQRSWPDRSKWLAFHSAWWASPERTLTDRNRKLKSMIITSFGSLPPRRRLAAAQRLAALVDEDPQLTKTQAEILVALLKALGGFGPTEGRLAWALSKSGQPSVVTPLVKHLIRQSAKESQSTLETMFSYMGKNVALAFLGNRESRLRAAACAGMWRYGGEEIDLALVKALGDKSMLVRRGAVYSLGKRGKKLSVPTLDDLLSKSADESLQRSIYTALGRIGGGAATQILLAKLKSAEDRMRPTLIAALGETRDRQVIEPLLSIYLKPKQDLLREVAAASLLALPRDAVQKRLVGLALDADADIKDRQSAVALLSRKWSRRVGTGLAALLNDGSAQLKQQAALVLAYYREKRAVPILLDALSRSPDSAEIRHALEAVTMTRFGVAAEEVVGKYRGWWAAQGKQSWRQWLLDALERDGFEVGGLRTYVKEGKLPAGGVEPLITALTDPRWYLAHGASLALNEIFDLPRPPLARLATGRKRQSTAKLWREVRLRHQEK